MPVLPKNTLPHCFLGMFFKNRQRSVIFGSDSCSEYMTESIARVHSLPTQNHRNFMEDTSQNASTTTLLLWLMEVEHGCISNICLFPLNSSSIFHWTMICRRNNALLPKKLRYFSHLETRKIIDSNTHLGLWKILLLPIQEVYHPWYPNMAWPRPGENSQEFFLIFGYQMWTPLEWCDTWITKITKWWIM